RTNQRGLLSFSVNFVAKWLKNRKCLTCVPAPGGTGGFWHVGCLPLKYFTLPESGDFRPRLAAYFRAS
ncbi:hypothetical protein, partial [Escherichia coli]|uniref:hypothetical protein n=1 Tax=Escherichia coli TaxID=562 RepID=UPI00113FC92F